jgi:hypothetical protein
MMRLSAKDVFCVGVEGSDFVLKISEDILDDPLVNFAGHFVAEECDSSALGVVAGWAAKGQHLAGLCVWQRCCRSGRG